MPMSGSLLLDSLDGDNQVHIFGHAAIYSVVHAPLGAIDYALEIAATNLTLEHWAVVAGKLFSLERKWAGLAHQCQLAGHFADIVAIEHEFVGCEVHRGILFCIKEVGCEQVLVEGGRASADRGDVKSDIDAAGLVLFVQLYGSFLLVEASTVY